MEVSAVLFVCENTLFEHPNQQASMNKISLNWGILFSMATPLCVKVKMPNVS
jgi:hypothetical protein